MKGKQVKIELLFMVLAVTILFLCSDFGLFRKSEIFSCPSYELFSISDDYYSDAQRTLDSPSDVDINASEGWTYYESSKLDKRTVVVAVIDTGVDYLHEDLADSMWINTGEIPDNGIDDDGNGYTDDVYGWDFYNNDATVCHFVPEADGEYHSDPEDCDDHGTHVAGIIAAVRNNEVGIAGVASCADVKIMSLKIHGGGNRAGKLSNAVKAIQYAEMMGADICNISWGTYSYNEKLYQAMAGSKMLFCVAAGNSGDDNDAEPVYPACFGLDNVISVAFTDSEGKITVNSNYGKNSVDVAVPAGEVYSTVVGGYKYMGGSSMATPHVTGLAALLFSLGVDDPAIVKKRICTNIRQLDSLADYIRNPGIIDMGRSLSNNGSGQYTYDPDRKKEETVEEEDNTVSLSDFIISKIYDGASLKIVFEPVGENGSVKMRYFFGSKTTDVFKNGLGGLAVIANSILLDKEGKYTFYCTDSEGNETVRTYLITDDTLPPKIENTSFSVSSDYRLITISASVSDLQSGIKKVKLLKGSHNVSDFTGKEGTELEIKDGKVVCDVKEEGTYTLYACDLRGNKTVKRIMCYIRKARTVTLDKTKKKMKTGAEYNLSPVIYPALSTDGLTFSSSDAKVASVDEKGVVRAKKKGTAEICVKADSGAEARITITVQD